MRDMVDPSQYYYPSLTDNLFVMPHYLETLLNELSRDGPGNLTIASLTAGIDAYGLGTLYESGKVKRMIGSYVGENKNFERMFFTGELEVELVPQGTIAARLRAAGSGMPAIFTPAGAGTMYANGGIPLKYASDGSVAVVTEVSCIFKRILYL